jgi:hypothetical protein
LEVCAVTAVKGDSSGSGTSIVKAEVRRIEGMRKLETRNEPVVYADPRC